MEQTATRLWKRLGREERLAAARHFFAQPPSELLGSAVAALVKARHLRPQVARALPPDEQARALAAVADPGESLAAGLVVALHLGERRGLLKAFLDAAGLPHEEGLLTEADDGAPLAEDRARAGVAALRAAFPREQVDVYLNALWLQDPDRWRVLERSGDWP
ncbi:MAG TPA: hypothetical protein VFO85_21965 [Vicinamibacteria bacterium]|nr:hypothetical protein [Vicinamibacteria bacterium]